MSTIYTLTDRSDLGVCMTTYEPGLDDAESLLTWYFGDAEELEHARSRKDWDETIKTIEAMADAMDAGLPDAGELAPLVGLELTAETY